MNWIRGFLEKIAYAGLKPAGPRAQAQSMRWLGPLRAPAERFLSRPSESDPLYLTNRTMRQKILGGAFVVLPFAVIAVLIYMAASGSFAPTPRSAASLVMKPADVAAKMLPDLDKIQVHTNQDLTIPEVHITYGSGAVEGSIKNNTNASIHGADVILDLVDASGSQLGGVSVPMQRIGPLETTKFHVPIKQQSAVAVMVREIRRQ